MFPLDDSLGIFCVKEDIYPLKHAASFFLDETAPQPKNYVPNMDSGSVLTEAFSILLDTVYEALRAPALVLAVCRHGAPGLDSSQQKSDYHPAESDSKLVESGYFAEESGYFAEESDNHFMESNFPLVGSDYPLVESGYPFVKSDYPVLRTEQVLVKSDFALVRSDYPIVESDSPLEKTNFPLVGSSNPLVGSDYPLLNSVNLPISNTMTLEFEYLYSHQDRYLQAIKEELDEEDETDTFHDSGTSGHEPDSLEAIQTLVTGDTTGTMVEGRSSFPTNTQTAGGRPSDAAVLLHLERCAHRQTRRDLQELKEAHESLQEQLSQRAIKLDNINRRSVGSDLESLHIENETELNSLESLNSLASSDRLVDELKVREMTISQLRTRVLQLQKDRLDKMPLDYAKELQRLNNTVLELEKNRDELTVQNYNLKSQLTEVTNNINDPAATYQVNKDSLKENGKIEGQNLKDIDDPDVVKILRKATYKVTNDNAKIRQLYNEFNTKEEEYKKKINILETELRNLQNASSEQHDREIRDLENRLEGLHCKLEASEKYAITRDEEFNMLKLDIETLNEENKRLKDKFNEFVALQEEHGAMETRTLGLEDDLTRLTEENRILAQDFNRERVLRKKYYNLIEEMKGKIRVFCRVRPLSDLELRRGGDEVVTEVEDEYSLNLNTVRGTKAFLFDRVFQHHEDQNTVFQDTHALIRSSMDGYNVTIMAYGQTGSGKTYTMLGTENNPGIAPRAFTRLFQLIEEDCNRHEVQVSTYMMELYNDKLIDLLKPNGANESDRLEIKRDKKGIVHVAGAIIRNVQSAGELSNVFNEGLANRHTAATLMNVESSRSHLLIAICLTVTSRQTGNVLRGKLTLVDLAGSERVSKSGASAEQLREANSINKSLSALGDVISALSSEASFVPYRNSKLTMLLQDSLGGNAKTLVFVNASPSAYNVDETLTSLMYASRIKQITNTVNKNSDNKEISRLKAVINKLRKGDDQDDNT
ncbi:unnamed protein product, partial [Meganyctiphanes norvegica]